MGQSLAGKPGQRTTLKIGAVTARVIMHGTVGDAPKLKDYATAGPNGRSLRRVSRAAAAPVAETQPGETVPVQKGEPMVIGSAGARQESGLMAEMASAHLHVGKGEVKITPVQPSVPTVDEGPGRFEQVLVEEPGEGESIDDMPALDPADLRKGIRQADGKFIDLTAQLEDIAERTKLDVMEVVHTMDVGQVPRDRVLGSMYVAGDEDSAPHVLRALMEAMRKVRRVPVVTWTAKSRQSLGVIIVRGDGAIELLKLAWAEDVREPGTRQLAHLQATVFQAEVDAMAELLAAYSETKREGLDTMRDAARELREELEERAAAGELDEYVFAPEPVTAVGSDLSELLRSSAEQVAAERAAARA